MLLSQSELNQMCICSDEAVKLAQCLKGHSFFGGYDNLVKTIGNLALVPKNRQVLFDCGIISMLKESALKDAQSRNGIFNTLLNMFPDLKGHSKAFSDSMKYLLTSDHAFIELIRTSNEEVCKGLDLLLSPYSDEPGMNLQVASACVCQLAW